MIFEKEKFSNFSIRFRYLRYEIFNQQCFDKYEIRIILSVFDVVIEIADF